MSNMKSLVSYQQISGNLRRTAKKGLISLLNKKELEKLAIKYYGETNEKGNLIRYYCPYSGEPITDVDKIVLEHIIPVTSNGGTVLFNCIPTSEEVNKSNEKGALHLLSWWTKKDYYSPEKLDKLLSYIFEAYDIVFKNNTIEQVKNSYDDIDLEEDEEENNKEADENTTSSNERQKLKEQAQITGAISYLGFINDCIDELKDKNYDTSKYEIKLKEYETKGIFKEVERYTLFQNILRETIKYKLDIENRSELTYTLNINISELMDSMKDYQTPEEITREILIRINNIEKILNENNIGLISFFEDAKNNDILYKKEITPNDIDKLVNEINLCVSDKFNKLCEFVEKNNGRLPSQKSYKEQEKRLGTFRQNIKIVNIKENKISTQLSKEQLQYLHDSKYDNLREIYKIILNNAIKNNLEIEYIDEEMKTKIIEYHQKKVGLTIEEQIKLEQDYKNYIIPDGQFNEFINFVLNNDGKLPSEGTNDEQEKRLGTFRQEIRRISIQLSKEQLQYLHDSQYDNLREIYKIILNNAIKNNLEIEYIDEEMKTKIIEYHQKKVGLTIEEQIKLEQDYKNYIIPNGQFNEFIDFVLKNDGKLPTKAKEQEKRLGRFRQDIQNGRTSLSKERLQYLHDSQYDNLREIYKKILNDAIKNNLEIEYIDEEMKAKIIEYHQKKVGLTIEEQIKLEQDYKNYIIPNGQFNEFINFVLNNDGKLPSKESNDEQEKRLGRFRNSIKSNKKMKINSTLHLVKNDLNTYIIQNIKVYKNYIMI